MSCYKNSGRCNFCCYVSLFIPLNLKGSTSAFLSAERMYGQNESKGSREKISDVCRVLPLRADFRHAVFWIFSVLQIGCRVHFLNIFAARFLCEITSCVNLYFRLVWDLMLTSYINEKPSSRGEHLLLGFASFLQLGKNSDLFLSHWKYHCNVCPVAQECR